MKIFVASDIHGSAYYCEKMIEAFKNEGADKLLLLGDILYHGPRNELPAGHNPKKVIELLNKLSDRIICVRGNCDAEVDDMVLDFSLMADFTIIETEKITIFASHGHHYNPVTPPKIKGKYILLNGHTHVPAFEINNGFYYVNPGSVSIPKESSENSYLIIEENSLSFKNLEGIEYMHHNI